MEKKYKTAKNRYKYSKNIKILIEYIVCNRVKNLLIFEKLLF